MNLQNASASGENWRRSETRAQRRCEITEHIEIFYNGQRRHSKSDNLAPAMFEQQCELCAAA